ncbi:glycoside hydrolase family 28 protein [Parabacteroides sp. 52]|uniref:glycoside hydrolase family 28 protein n=1 Tax=unclassified Parabacteroides TaxID=2649774 RepID=UPI0013CFD1FB|nr:MULTISPECIES: glycoside hydrolase family 28 protein [unclassified Parabacteroides]MDH6534152.1 polygalacturonase [Parabacteroides sp. PM5-20]NDV54945.1 glycoside hydrolase family 28 protein [Parabacteroides sp. 52]
MKRNIVKQSALILIAGLFVTACQTNVKQPIADTLPSYASYYEGLPFEMDVINRPQFPDRTFNIVDYGAVGDGITDNTEAIRKTIQEIAAQGGGKVVIPAGIWKTGPICLVDNINLHTEANALIVFDPNPALYPIIETSFEGLNTRRSTSPIHARNVQNIAITGAGVFDGSGDAWRFVKKGKLTDSQWRSLVASGGVLDESGNTWYPSEQSLKGHIVCDAFNNPQNLNTDAEWEAIHHWLRPVLVSIINCKDVLLEGVTFRNSPAWGIHPLSCVNFIMSGVKVFNPWYSQNGDGLDLESCTNALIVDNLFDVGDDAMCIKSGKDKDGRERNEPCQNVIIRNNTVLHGHGGFVVGSEMSGGVKNIYVADCLFTGTDVGLRFKSTRGRGGVVENIWIENIHMSDIPTEPLLFDLFYSGKSAIEDLEEGRVINNDLPPVTEETPSFRNISIRKIKCNGARRAMFFNGLPEMKIKDINVEDIIITSKFGAELVQTEGATFRNIQIFPEQGPRLSLQYTQKIRVDGKELPDTGKEVYHFND